MLQYRYNSYPSFFKNMPGCVNCKKEKNCTDKLFRTSSTACGDIEYIYDAGINTQTIDWHFFQLQRYINISINSLNTTSDRLPFESCKPKDGPLLIECRLLKEVLTELRENIKQYEDEYHEKLLKCTKELQKISDKKSKKGHINPSRKQIQLQEKLNQTKNHYILYLENICSLSIVCDKDTFHIYTTDEEFIEILANKNICFKLYKNEVTIPIIQTLKYENFDGEIDGTSSNIEERGKEVFGDF